MDVASDTELGHCMFCKTEFTVSIKISIVRIAIRVVHANCFLALKYTDFVAHHAWLVQCRLTVQNDDVSISQMPVYFFEELLGSGSREADVGTIQNASSSRFLN